MPLLREEKWERQAKYPVLRCGCGGRQHAAIGGGRGIWEGGLVQVLVHVEVELRVEIEVTNEGEEVY